MSNADLFATVAREYADFRPGYPLDLFAWLAGACVRRELAWDCGCGSGQASGALAAHFASVVATDASAGQIGAARAHPGVTYRVAPAECSGLAAASVDLVTVAQALHWFDVEAFHREVARVARPGALLAVWSYPRPEFEIEALDHAFLEFYTAVVGPFWPPERRHVDANYSTLPTPPASLGFEQVQAPAFGLRLDWSLPQVAGYVSSWSATARYRQQCGSDPVPLLLEKLRPLWPPSEVHAALRMPLDLRVHRLRPRRD